MAADKGCIASVREASGGKLSEAEAIDLLERTERKLKALEAAGAIDGLDERLAKAAADAADEAAIERALAAKHAAINVIKRVDLERQVATLAPKTGYRKALLALNEGTTRLVEGGRHSVQAIKLAFERRFVGEPMAKIAAERPHVEKMLQDRAFLDDVVREMAELRDGGTPGKTRNTDAQFHREGAGRCRRIVPAGAQHARRADRQAGRLGGPAGPRRRQAAKGRAGSVGDGRHGQAGPAAHLPGRRPRGRAEHPARGLDDHRHRPRPGPDGGGQGRILRAR